MLLFQNKHPCWSFTTCCKARVRGSTLEIGTRYTFCPKIGIVFWETIHFHLVKIRKSAVKKQKTEKTEDREQSKSIYSNSMMKLILWSFWCTNLNGLQWLFSQKPFYAESKTKPRLSITFILFNVLLTFWNGIIVDMQPNKDKNMHIYQVWNRQISLNSDCFETWIEIPNLIKHPD